SGGDRRGGREPVSVVVARAGTGPPQELHGPRSRDEEAVLARGVLAADFADYRLVVVRVNQVRLDPSFNGEGAGCIQHLLRSADVIIDAVEAERLADLTRRERRPIARRAMIEARRVDGVPLAAPPADRVRR